MTTDQLREQITADFIAVGMPARFLDAAVKHELARRLAVQAEQRAWLAERLRELPTSSV